MIAPTAIASRTIEAAVAALGPGPLTEQSLTQHIHPLFSRVLKRKEIYLANHSLGRPLDRTADDIRTALDAWYTDMDDAWTPWMAEIDAFRARIARLIGLSRSDGVVMKTAAGQGLRAVLNALEASCPHLVATRGEFDSLDFILKVYAHRSRAKLTWVEPDAEGMYHADAICAAIVPGVDMVVVSHVCFNTGQVITGIERIVRAAHAVGALVLLDTYHSAGVIPVEFDGLGIDFAVGGSYKYMRGGPGACWLAIAPHLLDGNGSMLRTLDTGWFAKRDTFSYRRPNHPEWKDGGDAWLESTPPFLTPYQAKAGQELTLGIGVERLRPYNLKQQAELAEVLKSLGVPVQELPDRGAFLLVPHEDAAGLCTKLKSAGVNVDSRSGFVRVCPDLLTTTDEIDRAAAIIARVMKG